MSSARSIPILSTMLAATILMVAPPTALEAQDRGSLTGTVIDASDGSPLEGATVSVLDTDIDAEADEEGKFLLPDVPVGELTLKVEHPGYSAMVEQVDVAATEITYFRVRLPRMEAMLRELLVAAGREKARSGGSEVEVPGQDDGAKNAADLLSETVPGVEVRGGQGIVGSGATIRIRGVNSITQSNDPAIYLDGIRIDEGARSAPAGRSMTAVHYLQTIPASEVERIRVLRGPSAAAQYTESANGVILIETRRGGREDREDGNEGEGG